MDYYHPEQTLFVTNSYWSTEATDGSCVKSVLFAQGISNIPAYGLNITTSITHLTLPITVRSLERHAFSESFSPALQTITMTSPSTVRTFEGSVSTDVEILQGTFEQVTLDQLTDYSNIVDFSVDSDGTFKVDFAGLDIRSSVTGYRIVRIGVQYYLYIFTDDGLVGYAEGLLDTQCPTDDKYHDHMTALELTQARLGFFHAKTAHMTMDGQFEHDMIAS
jgi:hypothetical protein